MNTDTDSRRAMNKRGKRLASTILSAAACLLLASCSGEPPAQAVGTLERDHITLPATQSEVLREQLVNEGDDVAEGALLLRLDQRMQQARIDAAIAQLASARAAQQEAEAGARSETRDEARARVNGAQSRSATADKELVRMQDLVSRGLAPESTLDKARTDSRSAASELAAARAAYAALQNGTRSEQLEQAQAAVTGAEAQLAQLALALDRLSVRAPRAGHIESLPYRVGDQPPAGAPLVVLLLEDRPHARIYVPEPLRATVAVGDRATITVLGRDAPLAGHIRWIAASAGFTPYYALSGEDAARLSFPAEIALDDEASGLPSGLPVSVRFGDDDGR